METCCKVEWTSLIVALGQREESGRACRGVRVEGAWGGGADVGWGGRKGRNGGGLPTETEME